MEGGRVDGIAVVAHGQRTGLVGEQGDDGLRRPPQLGPESGRVEDPHVRAPGPRRVEVGSVVRAGIGSVDAATVGKRFLVEGVAGCASITSTQAFVVVPLWSGRAD